MSDQTEKVNEVNKNVVRFDRKIDPGAHFALPAHPTVEQQLDYFSAYSETAKLPMYKRLWYSAKVLLLDWDCPCLPKLDADLSSLTDPDVATVIMWTGQEVLIYMEGLEALPKA